MFFIRLAANVQYLTKGLDNGKNLNKVIKRLRNKSSRGKGINSR